MMRPACRRIATITAVQAALAWLAVAAHVLTATGFPAVAHTGSFAAGSPCSGGTCGCAPGAAGGPDCCCSRPKKPAILPVERSCCAKTPTCDIEAIDADGCCTNGEEKAPAVTWVIGWHARQCKGHGPLGSFTVPLTVASEVPAADRFPPTETAVLIVPDQIPLPRPVEPPTPPPKSC